MDIVVLATRSSAHHFRPLEDRLRARFVYEDQPVPERLFAHEPRLLICLDEHYCELGHAVAEARARGIGTLQIMDGILEWRRTWDYTRQGRPVDGVVNPINQPALAHKIACLGPRDARILESWGNAGKCEIIGAPRLDGLVKSRLSGGTGGGRSREGRRRILVVTAKTPGFTPAQVETTKRSLACMKRYFDQRPGIDPVWRITRGLERELGIESRVGDLTGAELHVMLREVDAVITTPSTTMLEAMLLDLPTALLDFHNCPHYFEAAWSITSEEHIDPVVAELLSPSPARMGYQRFLLGDQLACQSPAADRLLRLIEVMVDVHTRAAGKGLAFPERIVEPPPIPPLELADLRRFYPSFPVPGDMALREVRMELSAAKGCIQVLQARVEALERRWNRIPGIGLIRGFSRRWRERR